MKQILLAFTFTVAASAAIAVDLEFKSAESGVVKMTGDGTGDVISKCSDPVKVKTASVYGLEYTGREVGSGVMLAGNKDVNVDRCGPDAGWYEYRQAYMTEGEPGGHVNDVFHYGHYRGKGEFYFKEGKVFELRPEYSEFSGIRLGHGEMIQRNDYRFDTSMQCFARNHARPLHHYRKASFNSNHWNVDAGSEIVYMHEIAGRSLLSASVTVASNYFPGEGAMLVQSSLDGAAWRDIAAMTNKGMSTFAVPADMLPAKRLFVRLFGDKKSSLQVTHYGFGGTIDGAPLLAYGASRYVNAATGAFYGEVKAPAFVEKVSAANAQRLPSSSSATLWSAVEDVKIFRATPLPDTTGKALSVSLAGNEAEAVQLVVTPREDVRDVRVSVSDLVLKRWGLFEKARLEASAVKVDRLGYVNVQMPTDETGARGEWPDPIIPQDDSAFPVKAGDNQPFWITVKTPPGLPKGIYKGTVCVKIGYAVGRAERMEVPFEVEVFGFDLPNRMSCETAFGFSPGRVADFHAVKGGSADHDRILEKYIQMLSDHHVSTYHWGKGESWDISWRNEKDPAHAEPEFDWSEFDDAHAELAGRFHFNAFCIPVRGLGGLGIQNGFKLGSICGVVQTNALYHTLMSKYLGAIERHLKEKGWLDASYVYWFDEPQESVYPQVNTGMLTLKRHAPGMRRMLTEQPTKALWDGVNLWNPRLDMIYSPDYEEVRARGDQFWWYVCCGPRAPYPTEFIDHAGCELRTWLWMTWARDVTGVLIWETSLWSSGSKYSDPASPQNPYEDPMAWSDSGGTFGNGDGRFVYPPLATVATPRPKDRKPVFDAPNASYRLAILRDGIEDYEYFAILKRLSPENPLLKVPESVFKNERSFSPDPSFMREHRTQLAREIERLGGGACRLPPPPTCVAARPKTKDGFRALDVAGGKVVANNFDDTIQEALWRVENGELDGVKADAVALVLGTQNSGSTPDEMAAGMQKVIDAIRRRRSDLKVLLYASFPCRFTWRNLRNTAANALYAKLADGKTVVFRDINGGISLDMFPDGVHPGEAAVKAWVDDIGKCLFQTK